MLKRYFFTEIHAVVEETLKTYISEKQIKTSNPIYHDLKNCKYEKCCFSDNRAKEKNLEYYLNKALNGLQINKNEWQAFFRSLTIIRNRTGHSNRTLQEKESKALSETPDMVQVINDKIHIDINELKFITLKVWDLLNLLQNQYLKKLN